jgi:hypothetical protein
MVMAGENARRRVARHIARVEVLSEIRGDMKR